MRRRSRKRGRLRADVNVTSLVDVAFTLLIVFIIIAPAMQSGIAVELPKTEAAGIEATNESIVVTVKKSGTIHIGQDTAQIDNLREALAAHAKDPATTPVFVRADRGVSYDQVAKVLGVVTSSGYLKLNLVTDNP